MPEKLALSADQFDGLGSDAPLHLYPGLLHLLLWHTDLVPGLLSLLAQLTDGVLKMLRLRLQQLLLKLGLRLGSVDDVENNASLRCRDR